MSGASGLATQHNTFAEYFTPIFCFLLFNVGDAVGRLLATFTGSCGGGRRSSHVHLLLAILRVPLAVTIVLSNIQPRNVPQLTRIHDDWPFVVALAALAISNGFVVTHTFASACK